MEVLAFVLLSRMDLLEVGVLPVPEVGVLPMPEVGVLPVLEMGVLEVVTGVVDLSAFALLF